MFLSEREQAGSDVRELDLGLAPACFCARGRMRWRRETVLVHAADGWW
uniref:Uncharacterized protein n=1 Tax=Arundo donax TaxID=35708 RepID=A0A0A9HA23_ARUDO